MRLPPDEDAAGQALGAGGGASLRVGCVAQHSAAGRVDEVHIAAAASGGGQQRAVGVGHGAVRVDAAVVQRFVDHGSVRWHDTAGHKPEGRAGVFVKAGQVDGGVHRVAGRVDDADGVGVFVGDEDAVLRGDVRAGGRRRGGCCGGCRGCRGCSGAGLGSGPGRGGGSGQGSGKFEKVTAGVVGGWWHGRVLQG